MSDTNPYAIHDDTIAAIDAPADARAIFLQKTYSMLLAAVAVFAATLWGTSQIPALNELARSIYSVSPWITLILFIGGSIAVHALAETAIGAPVFFAFAFLWGLMSAPLIIAVAGMANGATIIAQAALITTMIFIGLTAYVFKSGRDFGFMGGFLWTVMFGLFAVGILSLFGLFSLGIWYSYGAALLFAGFILYDTSNIMRRYPTTAHVTAAMVLFVDVIILFKNILMILASNRD